MTMKASSKESSAQSDTVAKPDDYQKALELAETGEYAEALECVQEYLISAPNDAEALNDVGTILHCMGRSAEAINHFVKARNLQPDSAEIIWNLSEAYLSVGRATESIKLFDDMEQMGILNADVLNRTADALLNEDNPSDALKMLHRSLELSPDQEILQSMIQVINHKMAENSCEGK